VSVFSIFTAILFLGFGFVRLDTIHVNVSLYCFGDGGLFWGVGMLMAYREQLRKA